MQSLFRPIDRLNSPACAGGGAGVRERGVSPTHCASLVASLAFSSASQADVLIDCSEGNGGGNPLPRPFYISDYPGTSLDEVYLYPASSFPGEQTLELVVRDSSYDGTILGTAQTTVDLHGDFSSKVEARFEFAPIAIQPGATVTFVLSRIAGAGASVIAARDDSSFCPAAIETADTTPPLGQQIGTMRIRVVGAGQVPVLKSSWATIKTRY